MLTVLSPSHASSSTKVTNTQSASRSMICLTTAAPTSSASRNVVEPKLSFMISTLALVARSRMSWMRQLVLGLPPQRLDVLLAFEVGEDTVGKEQSHVLTGHRETETREVMELPEHAGERRLATIVRAAHHKDPFGMQ